MMKRLLFLACTLMFGMCTKTANAQCTPSYARLGTITASSYATASFPSGITCDINGRIYYVTAAGYGYHQLSLGSNLFVLTSAYSYPLAGVAAHNSEAYAACPQLGYIVRLTPPATTTTYATDISGASDIIMASDGYFYAVAANSGIMYRISTGTIKTEFTNGLGNPVGILEDVNGGFYVVNKSGGNILKVSSTGVISIVISGLNNPIAITQDAWGFLYVLSERSGNILQIAPNGDTVSHTIAASPVDLKDITMNLINNKFYITDSTSGALLEASYKLEVCDSFTVGPYTHYTTGLYVDTLVGQAFSGCDSIVIVDLVVNHTYRDTLIPAPQCGSYYWAQTGLTYTMNGLYSDTLTSVTGCDSIIFLDLTLLPNATFTDTKTACDSLVWIDGNTYYADTTGATFTFAGQAFNGCDSVVTLDLTVVHPVTHTDIQTACDSLVWIDGVTYYADTIGATYTFAGQAFNGCDSIVTLDLTISTVTITTNPSDVYTAAGNNASFVVETAEANATFQWQSDNGSGWADISGETNDTLEIAAVTVSDDSTYIRCIVTVDGCSDTTTIAVLAIDFTGIESASGTNFISVYPNPASEFVTIVADAELNNAAYIVYDNVGRQVMNGKLGNQNTLVNISGLAKGVYTMRLVEYPTNVIRIVKN